MGNHTYVCFDGDNDIHYYRLMCAWKENDGFEFDFYNAHDLNTARDTSQEESIKAQLSKRLAISNCLVVLIGENTKNLHRFVRWEMEQALKQGMPIIGVNLNGLKKQDLNLCPPIIRDQLAVYIPFGHKIMQHALDYWPASHKQYSAEGKNSAYYYTDDTYKTLGL